MADETNDQTSIVKELSTPLYECKGWMKLVGVMSILGGALQVLTIVGIIIAWLPIWTGVLLFQSANAVEEARQSGNPYAMHKSLLKLRTYFIIMGILTLIGIIVMILAFFFGFLGAFFSAISLGHT
jgi:hypothetical protein